MTDAINLLDAQNEDHIVAVAEALFDYEPRNGAKRFNEVSAPVRWRYIDKAAWVLSQAAKTLPTTPARSEERRAGE